MQPGEMNISHAAGERLWDLDLRDTKPTQLQGDHHLLMVTLNGLPTDYDPVHTVIESTNNISLAQVQNMLHNHKALLHTRTDHIESINYVSKQHHRGKVLAQGHYQCYRKELKKSSSRQVAQMLLLQ
jgi:hypothetical protein